MIVDFVTSRGDLFVYHDVHVVTKYSNTNGGQFYKVVFEDEQALNVHLSAKEYELTAVYSPHVYGGDYM